MEEAQTVHHQGLERKRLIRHLHSLRSKCHLLGGLDQLQAVATEMRQIIREREGTDNEYYMRLGQIYPPGHLAAVIDAYTIRVQSGMAVTRGAQAELFVHPQRISQLRAIKNQLFDLSRLIRYCEELNVVAPNGCCLATAMLIRAILDHVPPIFGKRKFSEVASNSPGSKSFRQSMAHLEGSCRNIADAHLHIQVRAKETLPTPTQVNFSRDLDVLLGEIVRVLGY